ncbi:MAG: hypothetical protein L6Q92_06045 [Phycisphaerae bacterium]|nr:hypothetical protein [Phycisphaerae bacterium]
MWGPAARAIDHVLLTLLALGRPRYLRDTHALSSTPFRERIARWGDATCCFEPTETRGRMTRYRVEITARGATFETALYFERAATESRRLVLYHHGLGEPVPGGSFATLVARADPALDADRGLIVGLDHDDRRCGEAARFERIEGFEDFLACSVIAAKAFVDQFGAAHDRRVLAGMSIGGIAALIEAMHEPRFDANVSILATPFLAAMLLRSSFTRFVDRGFRRRTKYDDLRAGTDLDRAGSLDGARLIMINGRHDTMVDIDLLRPWWRSHPSIEVHELECSHLSGVISARLLRQVVGDVLRRELSSGRTLDAHDAAAYIDVAGTNSRRNP